MPTLTLYPSLGTAVLSGVVHVGQQVALSVVIDADEAATFASGHAYELTVKRLGYLAASPYVQSALTVTGARTATVALDLRLAAMYAAIGSRDALATQWSVDDLEDGVLGWTAEAAAIPVGNTTKRDGDVAAPPAGVAITAADLLAALAGLEGLSLSDVAALALAAVAAAGTSPSAARADHAHPLPSASDVGAAPASHVAAHPAPTDRDTRNEAADQAIQAHIGGTGNPHTAAGVGAVALSLVTTAGDTIRATGSGSVERIPALSALAEAGAGAWSPALKANSTHTVTRSGIWTGITPSGLEPGEGCLVRITGAYASTTTGLSAAYSGALDDIAAAVVDLVVYRIGSTYYGACREVV